MKLKNKSLMLLAVLLMAMVFGRCGINSQEKKNPDSMTEGEEVAISQDPMHLKPTTVGEELDLEKRKSDFEEYFKLNKKREESGTLSDAETARLEDELGECEYYSDWSDAIGKGCSWFCCGSIKRAYATSELAPSNKISYNAHNVLYTYGDSWVEGVKGYGIGESITIVFDSTSTQPNSIQILNGYAKTKSAYKNNSRVKTLRLYNMGTHVTDLELEDKIALQTFDLGFLLGERGKEWELKFEIIDVYKGDKYDDTAISLITFNGPCH